MRLSWRVAGVVLLLAGAAPIARADGEGDVQEELRKLRDRVNELEEWKREREAEDRRNPTDVGAAVEAYLADRHAAPGGLHAVVAPRSRGIQVGGMIRVRGELQQSSYTRADPDGRDTNDVVLGRVRAHANVDIAEDLAAFVEIQDTRIWGTEASTAANSANVDLSQGYVDFRNVVAGRLDARLGRQKVALSDQRFVGHLEWANPGRRFDGLTLTWHDDCADLTGFAYRVAEGFIEPAGTLGVETKGGDTDVNVYGLWAEFPNAIRESVFEAFAIYVDSGVPKPSEMEAPFLRMERGDTEFLTAGLRLHGAEEEGMFDWDFQAAHQFGELAGDPLSAWAARAEVGVVLDADSDVRPRLALEYDFATGEKRGDDGRRQQFQVLFPTNHGYYGIHDYQAWSNMRAWALTFGAKLAEAVTVKAQYWRFRMDEEAGGWVLASGALLRPGAAGAGRSLGQEFDIIVTWKQSDRVTWQAGWAHFFPGSFVRNTQGTEGGATDTDFFYLQTLITF